jgi:hypothetical protein
MFKKTQRIESITSMKTRKKRLDVSISAGLRDSIAEEAERTGKPMNMITDELLNQSITDQRGETLEKQSLPILRGLLQHEIGKAMDQLLIDLREALRVEFLDELQKDLQTSERKVVILLTRLFRETGIARHMICSLTTKLTDLHLLHRRWKKRKQNSEIRYKEAK